jgi:exodeoxyribonuclease V beta subunit
MSRNPSQRGEPTLFDERIFDAVESPIRGSAIIEASAGTGKTFNISHIFLRLIIEKGLPIEKILVVTFTIAATEELKERVRRLLRECEDILLSGQPESSASGRAIDIIIQNNLKSKGRLELLRLIQTALRNFDEASILTIHGFCKKMLGEMAFETGGNLRPEIDAEAVNVEMETLILDFWRNHLYREKNDLFRLHAYREFNIETVRKIATEYLKNYSVEVPVIEDEDPGPYEDKFIYNINKLYTFNYNYSEMVELYVNLRETHLNGVRYQKKTLVCLLEDFFRAIEAHAEFRVNNLFWSNFKDKNIKLKYDALTYTGLNISRKTNGEPIPEHPFIQTFSDIHGSWVDLLNSCDRKIAFLTRSLCEKIKNFAVRADRDRLSFQDLIFRLHGHLYDPSQAELIKRYAREMYRAALIDEFQDTDRFQWDIFREIFHESGALFFLIGDPKQSIYRFRGADINAYTQAVESIDRSGSYTLNENFRSTPELIRAVNTIFSYKQGYGPKYPSGQTGFLNSRIDYKRVSAGKESEESLIISDEAMAPFQIFTLPEEIAASGKSVKGGIVYESVSAHILKLLNDAALGRNLFKPVNPTRPSRPVHPRDIAILVRSGREAKEFQKRLRCLGINAVLQLDESVFESEEAADLLTILKAVHTPGRFGAVALALATRTFGCDSAVIHAIRSDATRLNELLMRFHEYSQIRERFGFMAMFERLLNDPAIGAPDETLGTEILKQIGGERRFTNLVHIAELLHAEGLGGIAADIQWISGEIVSARSTEEERQIRLENDEDAVQIMTVHKSKGLEFPIVYSPFAWESKSKLTEINPPCILSVNSPEKKEFLIGPAHARLIQSDPETVKRYGWPDHDELTAAKNNAIKEIYSEEIRLFYVAVTRASHRCYLVWDPHGIRPAKEGRPFTPSNTPPAAVILHGIDPFSSANSDAVDISKTIASDLKDLSELSDHAIAVLPLPEPPAIPAYFRNITGIEPVEPPDIEPRQRSYVITSYSRIQMGSGEERVRDYDDIRESEEATSGEGVMNFDRGARAGNFFHALYEDLDFALDDRDGISLRVQSMLQKYGYDAKAWGEIITDHAISVLSATLPEGESGFSLKEIQSSDKIHELDFLCRLRPRMRGVPDGEDYALLRESLRRTPGIGNNRGYIRGAIDLIFRRDGRYFLLDWKSNHLGNATENYRPASLREAMLDHNYVLQYYIYLAALDLHLTSRLKNYDYETHFGGIYYLFLRGISSDGKSGIFFDRPPLEVLRYFQGSIIDSEGKSHDR